MEGFRPPNTMEFSGNVIRNWNTWYQKLELFMEATGKDQASENQKIAILLNLIGDEGIEIYNTFKVDKKTAKFKEVVKLFKDYCEPRKNVVYERYKFLNANQKEGQTIESFITELKSLVVSCEYKDEDDMVRDKLVMGIRDNGLRERLLNEKDLTIKKARDLCTVCEASRREMQEMARNNETITVDRIQKKKRMEASNDWRKGNATTYDKMAPLENTFDCERCATNHRRGKCPAYRKRCNYCGKLNHFEATCIFKKQHEKKINAVEKGWDEEDDDEELLINSISVDKIETSQNEIVEDVVINNLVVGFKVDTGAQCNILPVNEYEKCIKNQARKYRTEEVKNVKLVAYGGSKIQVKGLVELDCEVRGKKTKLAFYIVDSNSKPILGLETSLRCNLIKVVDTITNASLGTKEEVIKQFSKAFEGLGKFPGNPYEFTLKEDSKPCINAARKVPKSLLGQFKVALEKLENAKVIKKVDEPTDWVNSFVLVEKPNKTVRICLNPVDLNNAIKREHYQIPSPEEIISELEGKNVFSVLDLKDSFYQIELNEASSKCCTFATPFGRYRFTRLPLGINTAAEVFQRKNTEIFGGILGNQIYIDDLIIAGVNEREHDEVLKRVLEAAQKHGITFNKKKFQYKLNEVKLLGFIVSKEGVQIDPARIDAIIRLENPKDKKGLLRFLGLVKYLGKFLPKLSDLTAPLRQLTREDALWQWEEIHSITVKKIKKMLTNAPILKHFECDKPIIIQCDASKDGLGACLLQNDRPVAYASRSLTDCEKRYAPIECELSAILFAAEKFDFYIYGRAVTVNTDHKPLVSIFKKDINKVPARLQRMRLRLMKYELEVSYLPGKEMFIADTLSRAALKDKVSEDKEMAYLVHSIARTLPLTENKRKEFTQATKDDINLKTVLGYVKNEWPKSSKNLNSKLKAFHKIKEEISELEGLLFYGDRVIVPELLRSNVLKQIHEGHLGITKCKERAKERLYWPGMSSDITALIMGCEICESVRNMNAKLPLLPHKIPNRPWEKVGTDLLEFRGKDYLVVIDYYSKWVELRSVRGKTANDIKKTFNSIFAYHGFPDVIMADNMPFNSYEMRRYLSDNNVNLITSSPHYPRSNGMAEKAVNIAKTALKKCYNEAGNLDDLDMFLLRYRNTPIPDIGLSPAQMLFSRRLKDNLPISSSLLTPKIVNKNKLQQTLKERQSKQKFFYDRNTRSLTGGNVGDKVLFKTGCNEQWRKGEIKKKCEEPRSFIVADDNNRKNYRRTRQHVIIRKPNTMNGLDNYSRGDHYCNNNYSGSYICVDSRTNNSNSEVVANNPEKEVVMNSNSVNGPDSQVIVIENANSETVVKSADQKIVNSKVVKESGPLDTTVNILAEKIVNSKVAKESGHSNTTVKISDQEVVNAKAVNEPGQQKTGKDSPDITIVNQDTHENVNSSKPMANSSNCKHDRAKVVLRDRSGLKKPPRYNDYI